MWDFCIYYCSRAWLSDFSCHLSSLTLSILSENSSQCVLEWSYKSCLINIALYFPVPSDFYYQLNSHQHWSSCITNFQALDTITSVGIGGGEADMIPLTLEHFCGILLELIWQILVLFFHSIFSVFVLLSSFKYSLKYSM